MADPRLEIVWSEAVRAIEGQARRVDELRSRAGMLLTAASVVASFLGTAALDDSNAGWWGAVGVAAFAGVVAACVYVLWPREFTFVQSARGLIKNHIDREDGNDVDQLRWALAEDLERFYDTNQQGRVRMARAITAACVILGVQVLSWLVEIGG